MDQFVMYLTASSHGVGQRLRLEGIDDRLRKLPLKQSLLLLSEMCFKAERASTPPIDVKAQIEFANRVLPEAFHARAVQALQRSPPCVVLSPQVIVLLGIRLLAVSSDEMPEVPSDDLARKLGALCLALGDHVDDGPLSAETTILETVRLHLFYGQAQHPGWLSLAGRLYFDVLPTLTEATDWCDPLARFESGTGLSLERFWAISAIQGLIASGSDDQFQFPVNIEEHPIPDEELRKWRSILGAPVSEAANGARIDISRSMGWSMTSIWKRPVLLLSPDSGPVLRPWLLEMQTEPQQMFWHVRDAIVEQGVSHLTWSNLYGRAVEILGLELLHEHVADVSILTEDAFVERWLIPPGSKRADVAVVSSDGDLVVVDFVSRQFTRETTAIGDFGALAKDLQVGVTEKLEQVDVTLAHAIKAGDGANRIFPVVVLAGPFPMFPPLDIVVNEGIAALDLSVIGRHDRCRQWIALDLLNWMLLLRVSTITATSVTDLLDQWQTSTLARNSFREWALRDGPAQGLPGGGLPGDWQERVNGYLGFPIARPAS